MKEQWYYVIGTALATIVGAIIVWSIWFVYNAFDVALNQNLITTAPPVTFNVDKLRGLLEKK